MLASIGSHPAFALGLIGIAWLGIVVVLGGLGYVGTERFVIGPAAILCPVAGAGAARVVGQILDRRVRIAAALVLIALAIPLAVERIDTTREQVELIPGANYEEAVEALAAAGAEERLADCDGQLRVSDGRLVPRLAYDLELPMDRVLPAAVIGPSGRRARYRPRRGEPRHRPGGGGIGEVRGHRGGDARPNAGVGRLRAGVLTPAIDF